MADNDGDYCTICGGIVPKGNDVKKIIVDGKEVGINKLDFIIDEVKKLNYDSVTAIKEELVKMTGTLNYIPSRKKEAYSEALFQEYNRK